MLAECLAGKEGALTGPEGSKPLELLAELHDRPGCLPERVLVQLLLPVRAALLVDVLLLVAAVQLRTGAVLPGVGPRPGKSELPTGVEDLQTLTHHGAEHGGLLRGDKVKSDHLLAALVSPLVKCLRSLVVPEAWRHSTAENQLVAGQGDGHHSEGLLLELMEDVHSAHGAGRLTGGDPLLVGLIVQHHIGTSSAYAQLQLHVGGLIKPRTGRIMRLKFSKMNRTLYLYSMCQNVSIMFQHSINTRFCRRDSSQIGFMK